MNAAILPVRYSEAFYANILDAKLTPVELTKFAYYNGIVVGVIACRTQQAAAKATGKPKPVPLAEATDLYIMVLEVLAPYRRLGIGRRLMEHMLEGVRAEKFGHLPSVHLHVQTNNDAALAFYAKFGFVNEERDENYYKRITPTSSFLLRKQLGGDSAEAAARDSK